MTELNDNMKACVRARGSALLPRRGRPGGAIRGLCIEQLAAVQEKTRDRA